MSEKCDHRGAPGVARIRKGIALIVVGAALVTFALAIIGPSEDLTPGKVAGLGAVDSSRSRGSAREPPRIVVPTENSQHECQPGPSHAPAMTIAERELARKYVRGEFEGAAWKVGEAVYLEWGGGGSTSAFGTLAARAYTVEHAVAWCDEIREWPEMQCMSERASWSLFCHDPGVPMEKWGRPDREHVSDEAFADIMRPYIQAPAQFTEATYDVVLIDGRYRTACAWAVLPYLMETSVVLWHDYGRDHWNAHPSDGALFQFDKTARDPKTHGPQSRMYSKTAARIFDRVEHVDALAVFRVKPSVLQQMRWEL